MREKFKLQVRALELTPFNIVTRSRPQSTPVPGKHAWFERAVHTDVVHGNSHEKQPSTSLKETSNSVAVSWRKVKKSLESLLMNSVRLPSVRSCCKANSMAPERFFRKRLHACAENINKLSLKAV